MAWLIVGTVAAACVIAVLYIVTRYEPRADDYPAEYGDGEGN